MDAIVTADPTGLLTTAALTVVYQGLFFTVACVCRFDKVTDFAGGTNFALLALATFFLFGSNPSFDSSGRQLVVTALVCVWAVRLACFLLFRILSWGEDRRFDTAREAPAKLLAFWVYQALWVWTVSLPLTILNASPTSCPEPPEPEAPPCTEPPPLSALDFAGWVLFGVGLAMETVADQTKLNFKADLVASAGRWCDKGLWSVSRHPNYCGEIMLWWGIFLACWPVARQETLTAVLSLLSPLFITLALLCVTGMPLLEASSDRKFGHLAEYRRYKARTSPLLPCPAPLYDELPRILKLIFCLELPCFWSSMPREDALYANAGGRAPPT